MHFGNPNMHTCYHFPYRRYYRAGRKLNLEGGLCDATELPLQPNIRIFSSSHAFLRWVWFLGILQVCWFFAIFICRIIFCIPIQELWIPNTLGYASIHRCYWLRVNQLTHILSFLW
ncbi:hypothetical protein F5B20DRAFT_215025 [Whalleya microplaca]|nr:hypothetical protein F5B20DRAFT_215025 [Whalleya microplaca]